jgi:hypothetical protein
MKMNKIAGGFHITVIAFLVFGFVSWCNNINFLVDSWDKEGLQIREVVAIVGVPMFPIGAINGAVYLFEDEVNY